MAGAVAAQAVENVARVLMATARLVHGRLSHWSACDEQVGSKHDPTKHIRSPSTLQKHLLGHLLHAGFLLLAEFGGQPAADADQQPQRQQPRDGQELLRVLVQPHIPAWQVLTVSGSVTGGGSRVCGMAVR